MSWALGKARVVEYVCGYEDYVRQTSGVRSPNVVGRGTAQASAPAPATPKPRTGGGGRSRRLSYNEQRELDALPARISALEEEQHRLKEEAASAEFYKSPAEHIHAVLERIDAVHAELDAALERWIELDAVARA